MQAVGDKEQQDRPRYEENRHWENKKNNKNKKDKKDKSDTFSRKGRQKRGCARAGGKPGATGLDAGCWEAAAAAGRRRASACVDAGAATRGAGEVSAMPWVEKHRPASLADVVANESIVATLRRRIAENALPHMLFYGPPGTGKTSTIMACAAEMHGRDARRMVLEINASDDNGIGTVRDSIKAFAHSTSFLAAGVKLVVLDEAEYLTAEAQAALRHLIEQTSTTTRFCFICNAGDAIIPAIQSRCARFCFRPLPDEAVLHKLRDVAARERLCLSAGAEQAIVRVAKGDMRRAINVAQTCAQTHAHRPASKNTTTSVAPEVAPEVTEDDIYDATGFPSPSHVLSAAQALMRMPMHEAMTHMENTVKQHGLLLADVVTELAELVYEPGFELYQGNPSLTSPLMGYVCQCLARIQRDLAEAADESMQIGGLVACFALARHMARTRVKPLA